MPHPTRSALLEAGLRIAETQGLMNMTVDQIVREAGVAKGTFYVHFPDRVAFLLALHIQFHERLKQMILDAIGPMPPGAERLYRAALTYLDGCLRDKAVKALLLEARSEPAIAAEVQRRNADFAALAEADFAAMGWSEAAVCARLFVAMSAEAALVELEMGGRSEPVRRALGRFVGRADQDSGRSS